MNQLIVNTIMTLSEHNTAINALQKGVGLALKEAKRNKRKIFLFGGLAAYGYYAHEKEIKRLKQRISEIETMQAGPNYEEDIEF